MQPSPGSIHSLPIKILYSLDTSSQSYLTILNEKHDVYVHPSEPPSGPSRPAGPTEDQERIGSCCLKGIAWGICFASHDFSVYNLDPILRSSSTPRSIAGPSSPTSTAVGDSWSGKGFLSWALSEEDKGTTLIRGRIVQEAEFGQAGDAGGEGGLEALLAAMNRTGAASGEGAAWGLEIVINLKAVPWNGAGGIGGRKEFEEMLSKGKEGLGIGSTGPPALSTAPPSPPGVNTARPEEASSSAASNPTRTAPTPRPAVQPPRVTSSAATSAPIQAKPLNAPQNRASAINGAASPAGRTNPAPTASTAATARPVSHLNSRAASSSNHPSSFPMSSTSSGQGTSRPSPASSGPPRQSSVPPPPPSSSSTAKPSSSSRAAPTRTTANGHAAAAPATAPSKATTPSTAPAPPATSAPPRTAAPAAAAPNPRDREITPPPRPELKSPPPSTPSRQTLHALLQTDSKMSPGLARQLANHPALLRLLKAVPATSIKSLQSDTPHNGTPTASSAPDVKPSPAVSDIPTPASVIVGNGEGCCNCGTLETDVWRIKKAKDGTEKKVCNDCGMYFNKHKKMRPPELWHVPQAPEKKAKIEDAHGIRSSPRLHRNGHSNGSANGHMEESPRKRKRVSVALPNPSPRRATRAAAKEGLVAPDFNLDFGAPSTSASTSASANGSANGNANGSGGVKKEEVVFSPSTMFMTSPIQPPLSQSHGLGFGADLSHSGSTMINGTGAHGGDANGSTAVGGGEEIDIEALLASFVDSHGAQDGNGDVPMGPPDGQGFDLEALFNNTLDPAMSQEMMSLLSSMNWDAAANGVDHTDTSK